MASDPYSYGGCWTAETCKKVQKFVDLAETFHLPIIYLVDCPGFQVGLDAEKKELSKKVLELCQQFGKLRHLGCQ